MIVQLTRMFLTNITTEETVSAQTDRNRPWSSAVAGQVRTYASGRQRAVGSIGASDVWKFTLLELTLAGCETLREWMNQGVTVFARDHRGQAMYGTFFGVERTENMAETYGFATYSAGIELQRVDVVEGV